MPALWLAIPIIIFCAWYASIEPQNPGDAYPLDASAKGSGVLPFLAPFCAACAAWEGSRLKRGRMWDVPAVRHSIVIAGAPLLAATFVGTAALLGALLVELLRVGGGVPDGRVVVVAVFEIAAWSSVGFLLGRSLPFALAGPIALVAPFAFFAFVPATYPVWLRHMTGMFRDCCTLDQDLSISAVTSSIVVGVGIALSALALTQPSRPSGRLLAASAAVFVAALAGGASLVQGMTYAPVVARDATQLSCTSSGSLELCLWPEHEKVRAELAPMVSAVRTSWLDAGLNAPTMVTEQDPALVANGSLAVRFRSGALARDDVVTAMSVALVPPIPECPGGATGGIASIDLEAWYADRGGMSPTGLQIRFGTGGLLGYEAPLDVVSQLREATIAERRDWIARAEQISQLCDDWPADRIAVRP